MKGKSNVETKYEQPFYLFPYEQVDKDASVIIYGFGKVGKLYYQQILQNGYCKVQSIVDKNASVFDNSYFPIILPEELDYEENIKVVVSVANAKEQLHISDFLEKKGFSREDIICTHHTVPFLVKVTDHSCGTSIMHASREEVNELYGPTFFEKWSEIYRYLRINDWPESKLVRVGQNNDGGYIMYDDLAEKEFKVAYSFGISTDVSWDNDMADNGYDIYMYDHTIDALPYERKEFHYFKKGISDLNSPIGNLDTLSNLLDKNGHSEKKNMILKMDVEGAEYGFILNTDVELLNRFDQIVMEIHNLHQLTKDDAIEKALKKLSLIFGTVHIHANNYGDVVYVDDVPYPDTVEITLLNRKRYELKESKEVCLPISLDMPCRPFDDEIVLGDWNSRE